MTQRLLEDTVERIELTDVSSRADTTLGTLPTVSVVIPCLNEERFIGEVLSNLLPQYERDIFEIIVVDGISTDMTREVVRQFIRDHSEYSIRLIDNPSRDIPRALNIGVENSKGDVIVRMDAHSIPSENYVRRAIDVLELMDVAVVGMPWRIRPGNETATARAIVQAVSHPFGIGDAKYRMPDLSEGQFVDTVPFGAFRKELWLNLGGFNEDLLANEDYDFHYRARRQGGRVFLDTIGHSTYFARGTLRDLARQYFRYGYWKAQMIRLHPRSIKLRQVVAPLFVFSVAVLGMLSSIFPIALMSLLAVVTAYASLAIVFAFQTARRANELTLVPIVVLAFLLIHVAWGSSFLVGLVRSPRR
jgi:glycosyltransferase involved in cell wall biosynthesis